MASQKPHSEKYIMENEKSDLQKKLESEGWRFVANEPIADKDLVEGGAGLETLAPLSLRSVFKPTRAQIPSIYRKNFREAHSEIRVEQAYDIKGKPLDFDRFAAVYVR